MYNEEYNLEYPMPSDDYDVEVFNRNFSNLADVCDDNSEDITTKQNKYAYVVASSDSNDNYKNCADFVMDKYDTTGLGRVINSLADGAKLILCPGNYRINKPILINKPLTIEGLNHKTVIVTKADCCVFNIENTDNVTIHNVYLKKDDKDIAEADLKHSTGIVSASNVIGLYIEKCGFYYKNIKSNETIKSVLQLSRNATDVILRDCVMSNCAEMLTSLYNNKKQGYLVDIASKGYYTLAIGANFAKEHSIHKVSEAETEIINFGNAIVEYKED